MIGQGWRGNFSPLPRMEFRGRILRPKILGEKNYRWKKSYRQSATALIRSKRVDRFGKIDG